ncbi:hypothetical protein M0D69_04410 [Caballeronia sp. SEWSISQ10-4 2]|uniref:hypothetical protein n=1 Tax=Caballeronia sp. SEWSISQ10-4 2 TaxID=2937438 RepID=UPI00264D44DB|nr:hypothetical protein [Caballeronia sp. SEWSISQ10-4 2]MDN7177265.1 hypothetical protein [Caballeronia sp. SEWSISQ10-4 2]
MLGAFGWTSEFPVIASGVVGEWLAAFISSSDELAMSSFCVSGRIQTLPVRIYNSINDTIDPLLPLVSTVLIVITHILMIVLDRLFGFDRVLSGKT